MKKYHLEKNLTEDEQSRIRKKGRTEPKYFNKVYVNVTAAAKMLDHAQMGIQVDSTQEVMGLIVGNWFEQSGKGVFVVNDAICLPVQSSETRVTADEQTYALLAAYSDWQNKIKSHNIIGWYHSHPSFGCWLSGIDVNTQERFQTTDDPFLALVVDPIKSVNLKKVDIGAFRVHPSNFREEIAGGNQGVPKRKAVDFGYHRHKYYQLQVEFFANELGMKTIKNIQKNEWINELASLSFISKGDYLLQEVKDEKEDIEEYLQVREDPSVKNAEIKAKESETMKKVAYYTKERNISLIDTAVKNLLF